MDLLIVGCGLIGGSIALAARRATPGIRIAGSDTADRVRSGELDRHFERVIAVDDVRALRHTLDDSALTVLASPVGAILELLPQLMDGSSVITDCGSTKRRIAEVGADNPLFVPGHPMAGKPQAGIEAASADLFAGKPWLLCPETASKDAVTRVEALVTRLGALPLRMSAEQHDAAVALTSHVPQLLASALTVLAEDEATGEARGSGFESATRVAGGSATVWRDILQTNADSIRRAWEQLRDRLEAATAELGAGNPGPAMELLDRARELKFREK